MNPVRIIEVGPRDGLQNEPQSVPTGAKVRFIEALGRAGLREIEATAFVSPKAIPQLADAEGVLLGVAREPGVRYGALVPNEAGFRRALSANVDEVAVFTAASEAFNQRNINASIGESFDRFGPVFAAAASAGVSVRGYVSTVTHCPFEGRIDPHVVVRLTRRLIDAGAREVSLGETLGRATPTEIRKLLGAVLAEGLLDRVALHAHDTYGMAVANVLAAFELGVRAFDASAGGLGGCPYAPGASGNVATEDLVWLFTGLGVDTGIDLDALVAATGPIELILGRPLPGRVNRARRALHGTKDRPS